MIKFAIICCAMMFSPAIFGALAAEPTWITTDPIFNPRSGKEVSTKDPSIIYAYGKYHLFFTVHINATATEIQYASAPTLDGLDRAERIRVVPGSAAPQVFFHKDRWYMACNGNRLKINTTSDLGVEKNWRDVGQIFNSASLAANPLTGTPKPNWAPIDFWLICDNTTVYVFYALNNGAIGMIHQPLSIFPDPNKWSAHAAAIAEGNTGNIFEAVHVYRSLADNTFYMQVEGFDNVGRRKLALYSSKRLGGTWNENSWQRVGNGSWASGKQLVFSSKSPWSICVSHPEAIRSNVTLTMEIEDINASYWIFMGQSLAESTQSSYGDLPWHLGIMRNGNKGGPDFPIPAKDFPAVK